MHWLLEVYCFCYLTHVQSFIVDFIPLLKAIILNVKNNFIQIHILLWSPVHRTPVDQFLHGKAKWGWESSLKSISRMDPAAGFQITLYTVYELLTWIVPPTQKEFWEGIGGLVALEWT